MSWQHEDTGRWQAGTDVGGYLLALSPDGEPSPSTHSLGLDGSRREVAGSKAHGGGVRKCPMGCRLPADHSVLPPPDSQETPGTVLGLSWGPDQLSALSSLQRVAPPGASGLGGGAPVVTEEDGQLRLRSGCHPRSYHNAPGPAP